MEKIILEHFQKNDPTIFPYIEKFQDKLVLTTSEPSTYFIKLCRSVAFQQLHGKAATTIWNRLLDKIDTENPTPQDVLNIDHDTMRSCGLSNAKANYIRNIAEAFKNDANYSNLQHLSDEEIIELLTKIKGVGRWTAEMFLMSTLGREDIFSFGDLGLKNGLIKVYNMKREPSTKRIEKITSKWKPYRSYGSLALWDALDIVN
jgi:DNA-3-methyladenine glycosylase II